MHGLLGSWLRFRDHLSDDFLGGPKIVKLAWAINLQKGTTLLFVLALMWRFRDYSATAWTYAALHGSYGLLWLLKDRVFPDPAWERKVTIGGAINSWLLVLGLYWLAPVLLVTQRYQASPAILGGAILLYAIGVVLMMGSDAQKYFVLRVRGFAGASSPTASFPALAIRTTSARRWSTQASPSSRGIGFPGSFWRGFGQVCSWPTCCGRTRACRGIRSGPPTARRQECCCRAYSHAVPLR